jgi:hypothetical protein
MCGMPQDSLPPHEHLVELIQAQLEPSRPPVITLTGAFGLSHLAQQCVH